MIRVSAGVCLKDGRVLVCQRGEGRKNAHLWEFPGGKQEKGETAATCLRRELMEELRLPVEHIRPLCQRDAEGIRFTFLRCDAVGEPVATEHEAMRFALPRELLTLPFCPADTPVARALALNAPPLRHFFWDFDGTIMDTYPMMVAAFGRAAAQLGFEADGARVLTLMKDNLGVCVEVIAREQGVSPDALMAAFRASETGAVPPIAGIPSVLASLTRLGGRHYLVTHRDHRAADMLCDTGLSDFFTDMVTSEDGFPRKPRPDSLRYLLSKHDIPLDTAVMIGDRPLDVEAGRNAGILSCLLDSAHRFPDVPCDFRITDAEELVTVLCPDKLDL